MRKFYCVHYNNNNVSVPFGIPTGDYVESSIQGLRIENSTLNASRALVFAISNVNGANFNCVLCSLGGMQDIGPGSTFNGNSSAFTDYTARYSDRYEITEYNSFIGPISFNLSLTDQTYEVRVLDKWYSYIYPSSGGTPQPTSMR